MSELLAITQQLYEDDLSRKDVGTIFNAAQTSRKGSMFKKEITASDLIQAWKDARYPSDVRDIIRILKAAKFSDKEINRVFKVAGFGSADDPAISPAMNKLSDYIIKQGYTADILKFLKDNYDGIEESSDHNGKLVVEDIRAIFDEIVKEPREELSAHLKQELQKNLGRAKK